MCQGTEYVVHTSRVAVLDAEIWAERKAGTTVFTEGRASVHEEDEPAVDPGGNASKNWSFSSAG